jgi:outer membrane protein TolC
MLRAQLIFILLSGLSPGTNTAHAQVSTLTIDECYAWARANYPLVKRLNLIDKSSGYSMENASKLYLPQFTVTGQATYQSQTINFSEALGGTTLPGGLTLPNISKDQYRIQAELNQMLYDGGNVRNQKDQIAATRGLQQQNVEVELYALNDRVNQIYFVVLLMEQQLKQNEIRKTDLLGTLSKMEAALKFGTAYRSTLDELKAELVNVDMAAIELRSNRSAYLAMLGTLIGREISDNVTLLQPNVLGAVAEINRPELRSFDYRGRLLDVDEKKIKTDYMPKLGAFVQGAYGRPTLNMVSNEFGPWYYLGARLNWNLASLYTLNNTRATLDINRQNLDVEKETFLLNTRIALQQQAHEIQKYRLLIMQDEKAIALRAEVKRAAQAQVENGVITSHDYIAHLNAENQARQLLILHQVQLLQAQYKHKFINGN